MAVGHRSIPCKRLTCQPKLAHERSLCPFIGGTQVRFWGELLFFFLFFPSYRSLSFLPFCFPSFALLFFPLLFCPPLISSSPFLLPSSLLSFSYSILFPFLSFFFTSCFLFFFPFLLLFFLSFLPLFYSPDFFLLYPSSLFLIVFVFVFSFSLKFLSCFNSLPRGLL